ncbi:MAG: hypothetical protein BWZ10_03532 [candidate division BRC1 bacterium ADurb.BinA364]|nr:MAG: hypothetical protein BWZ10_03532 [candidate division BRC1 bacterium ADurb.BinA364]
MLAWREAWKTRRWLLLYGLIGRKWPRRLLPLWLIGLFASNAFLLDRRWAQGLFAAQTGFYLLCAASGLAYICGVRRKWLLAPFYFIALNAAVLAGLWRHWRGGQRAMWRIERPQGETPPRLQGDCLTPCEGASCANENSKDSSVGKRQHPKTQP